MAEIMGEDNPGKIHILFWTDGQINRQIKRQAGEQKETQLDRQIEKQIERQASGQKVRIREKE
jgi:hypothetical protein